MGDLFDLIGGGLPVFPGYGYFIGFAVCGVLVVAYRVYGAMRENGRRKRP